MVSVKILLAVSHPYKIWNLGFYKAKWNVSYLLWPTKSNVKSLCHCPLSQVSSSVCGAILPLRRKARRDSITVFTSLHCLLASALEAKLLFPSQCLSFPSTSPPLTQRCSLYGAVHDDSIKVHSGRREPLGLSLVVKVPMHPHPKQNQTFLPLPWELKSL